VQRNILSMIGPKCQPEKDEIFIICECGDLPAGRFRHKGAFQD
jgi:hypothetical protein